MKRYLSFCLASLCVLALAGPASAQLRIVNYNTANGTFPSGNNPSPRTGMDNVLQAIGDELVNGIARPIDVLILQEQDDPSTTTQEFVDLLDGLYGAGTYGRSTVITLPNYADNIRQTLIYNTNTLSLIDEKAFGQTGSGKAARQTARFQLRPVGYDASADIYIYNSHYKASTGSTNEARRDFEANTIRTDSDALGQGANIIYAGDFNLRSSNEASYQTLLSAGNGQAFDPINTPGNWNNNAAFAAVHTQSPHDGSDGLVTGGMDDRFDFQIVSGELIDNEGLSYIPGSYRAFGNNGTTFNQAVNAGSNTYPLSQSILNDLAHVSDHLPVVADYQLPAMMSVGVGATPSTVIVGAAVDVPVTVTNNAPVLVTNGADELDYTVSGSGGVTGGAVGIANALAGGNLHNLSVDTSAAGLVSGTADVVSTSQNVANGVFGQNIDVTVLDHADASFASGSDQNLLTIDFGTLGTGGVVNSPFDLFNLEQTLGFTAGLDLDSIVGSGDTAVLGSNLSAFAGLAAGNSNAFSASFDTAATGSFSATYTLNLSDEDLAGATSQVLTLQLLGAVAGSLTGDLDGDGFVGIGDLNLVLGNWNQSVPPGDPSADPSGDGFIGIEDLNTVLGNWNAGTPPNNAAVPEPGTLVLLGIGLTALTRRGRSNRGRRRSRR
jgi:endonuclease/exonuclease/phosphatase family metal-dependent hydrolase